MPICPLAARLAPVVLALVACDARLELGTTFAPIVGGDDAPGHPAVGALVSQEGEQYQGPFCTGTLIDPRFVVTAAHCVAGRAVAGSLFFVGADARSPGEGRRPEGRFVPFARIHVHPQYRGDALVGIYDIAVVELAEAVQDVAFHPLPATPIVRGTDLLFVGFGADDGVQHSGAGVKRSTTLEVAEVAPAMFVSAAVGTGVCYGDSGGPALRAGGGADEVVGVNSSIVGQGDCLGASLQVRTDTQATWIAHAVGAGVDCAENPQEICGCAAACLPEGHCDPLRCGPQHGCRMLSECLSGCGDRTGCVIRCYGEAIEPARRSYEAVAACSQTRCAEAADFEACFNAQCGELWGACLADLPPGDADCAATLACSGGCRTRACQVQCYARGTVEARVGFDALIACVAEACAEHSGDNAAYNACAQVSCGDAWRACDAPDDCALTGGDCGEGACLPAPWGGHYCRDAGDGGAGQICDPQQVSCRDGLFCAPEVRRCRPICTAQGDCAAGQDCVLIEDAGEPFGTCEPALLPDAGPDAAVSDASLGDASVDASVADARLDEDATVDAAAPDALVTPPDAAQDALQPIEDQGEVPPPDATPVVRTRGADGCQTGGSGTGPWSLLVLAFFRRRR